MLYSLVVCPHRVERDLFADPAEMDPPSAFVELLWERGNAYEVSVIAHLVPPPMNIRDLPKDARLEATTRAMDDRTPLIFGGRLEAADLIGEPDLLRLDGDGYVAGDIKSGRGDEGGDEDSPAQLKLHYAVQLALYTDLLERLGVSVARRAFILDVDGREVPYDLNAPRGPKTPETWWEAYQRMLGTARAIASQSEHTSPALCSDCKLCHWCTVCGRLIQESGDLSIIPEVGRRRRDQLARTFPNITAFAAADLAGLAASDPLAIKGLGIKQVTRWQARARLQLASEPKPYALQALALPPPNHVLFFDVETDPMLDFCYLHGFWLVEAGAKRFVEFHTRNDSREEERRAFAEALRFVRERPDAAIVHYSPYERVTWRSLAARYPEVEGSADAGAMISKPRGFDLYNDAVRPSTEWPTRDYSIKSIAKWLGFSWRDANPSGAASIEWFQSWLMSGDQAELQRILDYNEDDCRAMEVVLDAPRTLPVGTTAG
jgi:uncharacterized protein